jgi:phospholipid/cholesterol/gamma-HCH transport system substrate-binding protein
MTREARIGIFVGIAFLILAVFIFVVGDLATLFRKPGYPLSAEFPTAAGLEKKAAVKMAGVEIGLVKDIRLSGRKALVVMDIDAGIKIPKDSEVTFSMAGLLGEKTVEIVPGTAAESCAPGEMLPGVKSVGFDDVGPLLGSVGEKIKLAGDAVGETLGPETRADLARAIESLADLASEIHAAVRRNRDGIGDTVATAEKAAATLDRSVEDVAAAARETLGLLKDMAEENRDALKGGLERIRDVAGKLERSIELLNASLEKINRGEGTLGKIIQDPELYRKADGVLEDVRKTAGALSSLKPTLDLETGYYGDGAKLRSALSGGIRFGGGASFSAGLVRDPWRQTFTLSLQGGYRRGSLAGRAGFIESEFGVGMDVYALDDRWVTSLEGFDFNRADSPHLRLSTRFFPVRNVFLMVGADDFTLAGRRDVFFGLGVSTR